MSLLYKTPNTIDDFLREKMVFDVPSHLKYKMYTESDKQTISKNMIAKLFRTIKKRGFKLDFGGIERTKGNFKSYPKYKDIENAIDCLKRIHSHDKSAPDEILTLDKTLQILNKYRPDFEKAFRANHNVKMLFYNTLGAALINATSSLIASTMEFVQDPNSKDYKMVFEKNANKSLVGNYYFDNLKRVVAMDQNGQLSTFLKSQEVIKEASAMFALPMHDRFGKNLGASFGGGSFGGTDLNDHSPKFDEQINSKNPKLDLPTPYSESFLAIGATVILATGAVLFIVRQLIFTFFHLQVQISEKLLQISYWLEANYKNLEAEGSENTKAIEKQKRLTEKLRILSQKIYTDDESVKQSVSRDEKESDQDVSRTETSDDDILI